MKNIEEREIQNIVLNHRNRMNFRSNYGIENEEEMSKHTHIIAQIGGNYCAKEGKKFIIDENNRKILRFMLYYVHGSNLCENVFTEKRYKLSNNILIIGGVGTGKTLLMQIFSDYCRLLNLPMSFENMSVSQLINCQKTNGNIDKYTFCENTENGKAKHLCLNDLGLEIGQNIYGTNADNVIEEFLFSRYELFQQKGLRYHITANLTVKDFKEKYNDRLTDRFKAFNTIVLNGESRRGIEKINNK